MLHASSNSVVALQPSSTDVKRMQQVEERRLGLDGSHPLAVLQWDSLIAVNYAGSCVNLLMDVMLPDGQLCR